jgi:uncharacterized protein
MRRGYLTNLGLAALAVLMLCATAHAGQAAAPTLTVEGRAALGFHPDQAKLVVGVDTRADQADQAAQANSAAMSRVLAQVKKLLGPGDLVQTQGYRLSARTRWNKQLGQNQVTGYQASNRVEITTGDPKKIGPLLDAAVAAGANNISGPVWGLADQAAAQKKAQQAAVADALAQAKLLAKAAGMALGGLLKMNAAEPRPAGRGDFAMAKMVNAAPTPLETGQVKVHASVVCVFALQPGAGAK